MCGGGDKMNNEYFDDEFSNYYEFDDDKYKNNNNLEKENQPLQNKYKFLFHVLCVQTFICVFLLATLGGLKIMSPEIYKIASKQIKASLEGPRLNDGFKSVLEKIGIFINNFWTFENSQTESSISATAQMIENDLENSLDCAIISDSGDSFLLEFKQPAHGKISSKFGKRTSPLTGKSNETHNGVDIVVGDGTPILAMADGTISKKSSSPCFGNFFFIKHADGYESLYAHCSEILVEVGNNVAGGQIVAKSGHSGLVTGPHLHFGVKKDGKWINPSSLFPTLA